MVGFFRFQLSFFQCRTARTQLAAFWLLGLLSGSLIALSAGTLLAPTMRSAVSCGMSIFGLLAALLLPLLFTAMAVYISQPALLFPVVFFKGFLFSFTGSGVLAAFGASGWLIRVLLMFSDLLVLPLLWWIWLRSFSNERNDALRCSTMAAVIAAVIGCFDYAFVAPFLAGLL